MPCRRSAGLSSSSARHYAGQTFSDPPAPTVDKKPCGPPLLVDIPRPTEHESRDSGFQAWQPDSAARRRINSMISRAWRPSTAGRYALAVSQFTDFCASRGIPFSYCLPASEALLCDYASSLAGHNAGSTIRNECSALRGWHIQHNVPWFGGIQLSYVIKGAENMRPPHSLRPDRPAVTSEMLDVLSAKLDLSNPFDVCVLFVATTAFWGQLRLGEILPSRSSGFVLGDFPRWEDLKRPNANGSRVLHLPRTKTGGTAGENVIITRQIQSDPIAALLLHQNVNGSIPSDHVASYWLDPNTRVSLTKQKFVKRVNDILLGAGFDGIPGHCFRIGGTTHLLLAGVPPDIVKLMGRWSSDAFLRYWRSLEIIAPLHAELLRPILNSEGRPSS